MQRDHDDRPVPEVRAVGDPPEVRDRSATTAHAATTAAARSRAATIRTQAATRRDDAARDRARCRSPTTRARRAPASASAERPAGDALGADAEHANSCGVSASSGAGEESIGPRIGAVVGAVEVRRRDVRARRPPTTSAAADDDRDAAPTIASRPRAPRREEQPAEQRAATAGRTAPRPRATRSAAPGCALTFGREVVGRLVDEEPVGDVQERGTERRRAHRARSAGVATTAYTTAVTTSVDERGRAAAGGRAARRSAGRRSGPSRARSRSRIRVTR